MRIRATLIAVLIAHLGTSVTAAPALALQPGAYVNPSSPAASSIPSLDVLRGAAVGHAAPQGVAQPLFGVGIGGAESRSAARSGASRSVPERELASLIRPQSPTTQVALLALVVLLAGTLLGVATAAARRRG